jgi:hypothetical protein
MAFEWFRLLDHAAPPVTGPAWDFRLPPGQAQMLLNVAGAPTDGHLALEVSWDGSLWWETTAISLAGRGPVSQWSVGLPVARYLRARLDSLTGGTSPNVTLDLLTT